VWGLGGRGGPHFKKEGGSIKTGLDGTGFAVAEKNHEERKERGGVLFTVMCQGKKKQVGKKKGKPLP